MWWMLAWRLSGSFLQSILTPRSAHRCVRDQLDVPAFMALELGNLIAKKIRRGELTREEGRVIQKELRQPPLQQHADARRFPAAYELAVDTQQSL